MSKVTFRADEELVERIEARDASKSEIMREALRAYLDREDAGAGRDAPARDGATSSDRGTATDPRPAGDRTRPDRGRSATLDALLAERVDALVTERLAARESRDRAGGRQQDVNVNVTLEPDGRARADAGAEERAPASDGTRAASASDGASDERGSGPARAADDVADASESGTTCGQCGESLSDDHVYCPNCGEKATRRVFCECGDEVRSDWSFCPGCGRRTPAADVLDRS